MSENKIVITGHTTGLGKAIYDKFTEVSCRKIVGLSRSNGYDIDKDFDKVVEEATGAEIFINNAYRDKQQLKLLHALKDKVDMMIVMGSVSRFYPEIIPTDYVNDKQELAEACRAESLKPNSIPILHLDLGFLENPDNAGLMKYISPTDFTSDYNTPLEDVVDTIMFWAQKPNIREIEFTWKLTDHVRSEFNRINPNADLSRVK
tara:strand:+ start:66 stop:677 length:612 start_codon:yes stop_codon:yes gene_type:complete